MRGDGLTGVVRHLRRQCGAPPTDGDLLARFAHKRDEAAFAELVRRHGGLVLGVARRQLADRQQAEDVFQTTFLALARQAARLGQPPSLVNWLYTVALRHARKALARAARKVSLAQRLPPPTPPADPLAEISGRELVAVIDDELARLPEAYRVPLLLCGLQGLARDEAARRLGWSVGAVKGRLERGRDLLRKRLEARGLTVPAVFAGVLAADSAGAVPPEVIRTVTRAALAAPAAAGPVKVWVAAAAVLALGVGIGAVGLPGGRPDPPAAPPAPAAAAPAVPQPRVDREGVPLPPGVLARLGSSRLRHAGVVYSVAVAPDGRTLASAGQEGVRVWETATGQLIRYFPFPSIYASDKVCFAADGRDILCVTTGPDMTFLRLDPTTGRERRRVELKNNMGQSAWIAPSGRLFAYRRQDNSVRICDALTGREVCSIAGSGPNLAFSPDDRTLAITDISNTVALYDTATGVRTGEVKHEKAGFLLAAFSPDGRTLAAYGRGTDERPRSEEVRSCEIHLWDLATRQHRGQLQGNDADLGPRFHFSPDGKTLATAGPLAGPILWDVATGREIRRFCGAVRANCAAFSPTARR
jgi:RNA polymerase sigma factor (sigma-70 family)